MLALILLEFMVRLFEVNYELVKAMKSYDKLSKSEQAHVDAL